MFILMSSRQCGFQATSHTAWWLFRVDETGNHHFFSPLVCKGQVPRHTSVRQMFVTGSAMLWNFTVECVCGLSWFWQSHHFPQFSQFLFQIKEPLGCKRELWILMSALVCFFYVSVFILLLSICLMYSVIDCELVRGCTLCKQSKHWI